MSDQEIVFPPKPPLDPNLYPVQSDEIAFFKEATGIQDDEELKRHVLDIQAKVYNVFGYTCIRSFGFMKVKVPRHPAYKRVRELPKLRPGGMFLDIGCCLGTDLRRVAQDGWPVENIIASDLHSEFWSLGHQMFKSTPETFPAAFVAGNAFSPEFIAPREPFDQVPATPVPALKGLTSLTPLQGHISAIHASSFFHLFNEAEQLQLAKQLATLLSPLPGSTLFGMHGGTPEKGLRDDRLTSHGRPKFCHCPESWTQLWEEEVFSKGKVKVDAGLKKVERPGSVAVLGKEFYLLWWSVTRL